MAKERYRQFKNMPGFSDTDCHHEGIGGNCGVNCRVFMAGNCKHIYDDPEAFMDQNPDIDTLIDITDYYPDLFEDRTTEIFDKLKQHNI